jgi:glycosyltransferase involved in cell wall biosynthesis
MIYISVFQPVKNTIPASGVGKIAFELFHYLKNSHNVHLYFSSKGDIQENNVKDLGGFYFFLYRAIGKFKIIMPYYKIRHIQEILFDIFLSTRLNKDIQYLITTNPWIPRTTAKANKNGIKVFYIAGNPNDNMIYNLLKVEKKKLQINTVDAFDYTPRLNSYNRTLPNFNIIFCINDYIYDSFKKYPIVENKLVLLYTIFDANFKIFDITKKVNSSFRIFYCAHSTTLKGLHILLEAFNKFKIGKENIELLIGGNIERNLFLKINDLMKGTIILGNMDSKQIATQLKSTSIFIVPSLTDAAPVSMIEAMYSKTPVICSDGVGHQWLIEEGYNGFKYSRNSTNQLIEKLELAYSIKNDLKHLGENARKTILEIMNKRNDFFINFEKYITDEDSTYW